MSLRLVRPSDVVDPMSYAQYAQQSLGTPVPGSRKDLVLLQCKLNEFWEAHPKATWATLSRLVDWARAKKRRTATAWGLLHLVRFAWKDGALPELDPAASLVDNNVEYQIEEALKQDMSDRWRRMLIGATGVENRRTVLTAWRAQVSTNVYG